MNEHLEKVLAQIKRHPKVVAIYLFGSYAKGEAKPISDIDIAVVLREEDPITEAEIGSLYSDSIDLVLVHRLPLYIQFEVFKYGKEIFVRDEEYLMEIKRNVLKNYLENSWLYHRIKSKVIG